MAKRESTGRPTVPTRDTARIQGANYLKKAEAKKASSHLAALLDRKNTVEYEGRLCRAHDAEAATKHAERLVAWARRI